MYINGLNSEFLEYLVAHEVAPGERLPTLVEIGEQMGISVGKLREQLEVARSLGLVSVRPRIGVHRESFDFAPAVRKSALFALKTGEGSFQQFSQMRRAIETALWPAAVTGLTGEDLDRLWNIVHRAWEKLRNEPVHIPKDEHRRFHLILFSRLDNPFVAGVLEAYWDIYEASELTRLASYDYWIEVWRYHEAIVGALEKDDIERGQELLVEHFELLPSVSGRSSRDGGLVSK